MNPNLFPFREEYTGQKFLLGYFLETFWVDSDTEKQVLFLNKVLSMKIIFFICPDLVALLPTQVCRWKS